MRWLKHLSMAHEDPKMSELLETEGLEGYGAYWLLLECIAAALEAGSEKPELTHSDLIWSQKLHVSLRKCRRLLLRMGDLRLISIKSTRDRWTIEVRNLLKYRDEWSKKSGVTPESTPEKLRPRTEQIQNRADTKQSTDTQAKPPIVESAAKEPRSNAVVRAIPSTHADFEAWWCGWSQIRGTNHRPQAFEAWLVCVKQAHLPDCFECTRSYLASLENPAKGYNPENFLRDQARSGFRARWPPKRAGPAQERKQAATEKFRERMRREMAGYGTPKIQ